MVEIHIGSVGIKEAANDPVYHRAPPSVAATASQQVVRALQFYASGGVDRGQAASKALLAMNTALEARHQTT